MKGFVFLFFIALCPIPGNGQDMAREEDEHGFLVREGQKKILYYRRATNSLNGRYPRAHYIHPLYGMDGMILTEDFPEDHLHHRGIFWAWHQVLINNTQVGDAWECRDITWNVIKVSHHEIKNGGLQLMMDTMWKSPNWKDGQGREIPFLKESTTISIFPARDRYRVILFESSYLAQVGGLSLGGSSDEKGYGGFSVRMKLPEDIRFSSDGVEVIPATAALSAGLYMDISGSLAANNREAGLVLMSFPDRTKKSEQWILRSVGSMQNVPFPGREPLAISEKAPLKLKYGLIVYKGSLSQNKIDNIYKRCK